MTPTDAIFLGALQGATEFLPISSSGHLRLAEAALSARPPSLLFDVSLHLGTLVAVILFFRRDLAELLVGLWPGARPPVHRRQSLGRLGLLVLASIPTALMGLLLQPVVEGTFSIRVVGGLLLVNGLILLSTRRPAQRVEDDPEPGRWGISPAVALAIGLAQGVAVLPGISRSGITIATAMLLGVRGRPAAVFSFLLSIPAILGAAALEMREYATYGGTETESLLLGIAVALAVGLACLSILLRIIGNRHFHRFAWYCFALGIVAIAWGVARGM